MLRLQELEGLLRDPAADGKLGKAQALTMYIARSAPNGRIANLAMQAMSGGDGMGEILSQLRAALSEAQKN
jgi:hypothetical protein